jgi:biotin operon repressor
MNKNTSDRYERIGAILAQISLQKKITPLERLTVQELWDSDQAFITGIRLVRLLDVSENPMTLREISDSLGMGYESVKVVVRSMKAGGFEFSESREGLQGTGGYVGLTGLNLKTSALSYLIGVLK